MNDLIDWAALNCDGMPAYCDALRRLESAIQTLIRHQGCLEADVMQLRTQVAALRQPSAPSLAASTAGSLPTLDGAALRYVLTPGYPQEDYDGDSRDD